MTWCVCVGGGGVMTPKRLAGLLRTYSLYTHKYERKYDPVCPNAASRPLLLLVLPGPLSVGELFDWPSAGEAGAECF